MLLKGSAHLTHYQTARLVTIDNSGPSRREKMVYNATRIDVIFIATEPDDE